MMRSVRKAAGCGVPNWRVFVCLPLIATLPVSLLADESPAAMLRSSGGVQVNKSPAPSSTALLMDDLIETQQQSVARIEITGSVADINPETVVKFEGDELVLEHGSLSVNTSRLLRVRVGCLEVTPVTADWTHYEVADLNGRVTVSALKSDVNIDQRSGKDPEAKQPGQSNRVTVREGERKSREEKCAAALIDESAAPAAKGAILNSPYVKWPAVVGIGVLTCWALCRTSNPLSPSNP
jgi:hypothetical protein